MCVYTVCIREEEKKTHNTTQHTKIMYNTIKRNHFNYDAGEENIHTTHTLQKKRRRRRRKEKTVARKLLFRLHFYITFLWWTTDK